MAQTRQERELAVTVTETLAESVDRPIEELPPISDAIDLDALDAIVPPESASDVTVSFTYEGRRVLVHAGPTVWVQAGPVESGTSRGVGPVDEH